MATITIHLDNPGEEIKIKVDDKAVMSLFTDVSALKQGLRDLNERIDLLCKAGFVFIAGGFGLVSTLIAVL